MSWNDEEIRTAIAQRDCVQTKPNPHALRLQLERDTMLFIERGGRIVPVPPRPTVVKNYAAAVQ